MNNPNIPPAIQMLDLVSGLLRSEAIIVAAKLNIADLLQEGPMTVEELAKKCDAQETSLYRLLRALNSIGIFTEISSRKFALNPLAETLLTNHPQSIKVGLLFIGSPIWLKAWHNLLECVKTGESGFKLASGKGQFEYFKEDPEFANLFNDYMTRLTELQLPVLLNSYDFGQYSKIVDVGGGHGLFLTAILEKYPQVSGILYDSPEVIKDATNLGERCTAVAGNMFESVPEGGDIYLFKGILHDWDDEHCLKFLKNCRSVMSDGARVLVIDSVVPEEQIPPPISFMDLAMLAMTEGGRERTEAEFRELFSKANLELTKIIPTPSTLSFVEAKAI